MTYIIILLGCYIYLALGVSRYYALTGRHHIENKIYLSVYVVAIVLIALVSMKGASLLR